jgi:hypothetical protein
MPWFDVYIPGQIRRCDWLKKTYILEIVTGHIQKDAFLSAYHSAVFDLVHQTTEFRQANDSVNYSG